MKPNFIIVGAMKAGTTSVYRDLSLHPDIFLPRDKEPNILIDFSQKKHIDLEYAKLFRASAPKQLCGEASTSYTKAPTYTGVADKAFRSCGPALKIIYMRRDPVQRIVSQYKHEVQHGTIDIGFDEAVKKIPRLIDYSRYDWQIAPWIASFGADNVMQIDLEDYSAHRQKILNNIILFLGLSPAALPKINVDSIANSADEAKTISSPLLHTIVYSKLYQRRLKTLIPDALRAKIRNAILPKPIDETIEPSKDIQCFILSTLGDTCNKNTGSK